MGRILAIDYGTKRIGVAISDETKKIALPQPYILTSEKEKLLAFIKEKEVVEIVVGLPRGLAGQKTKSTEAAEDIAEWLRRETKLQVNFFDEWFSTKEAARKIEEKKLKGRKAREEIDSLSAQILLDAYLRRMKND